MLLLRHVWIVVQWVVMLLLRVRMLIVRRVLLRRIDIGIVIRWLLSMLRLLRNRRLHMRVRVQLQEVVVLMLRQAIVAAERSMKSLSWMSCSASSAGSNRRRHVWLILQVLYVCLCERIDRDSGSRCEHDPLPHPFIRRCS